MNLRQNRLSLILLAAASVALTAAAVLFVFTLTAGPKGYSRIDTAAAFSTPIDPAIFATPTAPPSEASIAELAIPRFDVTAPVVVRGVDSQGIMESPDGPTDVAWYNFTAKPGFGGNAVFAGHVDYINYGPAVFWHLQDLNAGDLIEVRLEDGTLYRYEVKQREQIDASTADVGKIIGPSDTEILTLITCGGTFDSSSHQYDQRVIVRAQRLREGAPNPAAGASSAPSS